jgi:lipopolysaccharide assembly protein A
MIFLVFAIVVCVPFAVFALSNMDHVRLGLWPTDYAIDVPISLAILTGMALGILLGALAVWVAELGQRRRARRAERTARLLQAKVDELQARLGPVTLSLPPTA